MWSNWRWSFGEGANFYGSIVNVLGSSNYQNNLADYTGGGISAFQSSFKLAGQTTLESNKAETYNVLDCTDSYMLGLYCCVIHR